MKVVTKILITGLLIALLVPVMSNLVPEPKSGQVTSTLAATSDGAHSIGNILAPEAEIISLDMPEKYSYLNDYHLANADLEDDEAVLAIAKVFDEGGININAYDVDFYVSFDDQGFITELKGGLNTDYKTIKIHEDFDEMVLKLSQAGDAKDVVGILGDVTLPLEYYIKLPAAVLASGID